MTGYMEMRFNLSCISYKPCTDFFCLISGGMLNLTLAVLECHQPGAVRLAVTSLDDFVETTFTQSEIVEVAFIGNNATWYVMIEHLEGGTKLGFQVRQCTQSAFQILLDAWQTSKYMYAYLQHYTLINIQLKCNTVEPLYCGHLRDIVKCPV